MRDMEIYIDQNTNTDKILNRKELKPKYRIGDTFRRIGTRGYWWWIVKKMVYSAIEPIYVLEIMPFGKYTHEIGESELCENWYNITIKIPDNNELLKDYI